jgi:hypothetical protein
MTTTTDARPVRTPRPSAARRATSRVVGVKALIAASSLAVVLGGWAAIAAQPPMDTGGAAPPAVAVVPLPTLVPPPAGFNAVDRASPRLGPAGLRSVSAPPPVVVTRSSR